MPPEFYAAPRVTLYRECAEIAADMGPGCCIDPYFVWRAAAELGCDTMYDGTWDRATYDRVLLFLFADLVTRNA